jgi:hypothetical protein
VTLPLQTTAVADVPAPLGNPTWHAS